MARGGPHVWGMDSDQISRLIYLGLILAALGGWAAAEGFRRPGATLRMAMAWGTIIVAVAAGYGLWRDIAAQNPVIQRATAESVSVSRSGDGHFHLVLTVNGAAIPFLVDTGASGVVLSDADARRAGIDPGALAYLGQASTANGTVRTARVRLDSVRLGPFQDDGLRAYVTDGVMDGSLLGMDYLNRFHMEIAGDRLSLRR